MDPCHQLWLIVEAKGESLGNGGDDAGVDPPAGQEHTEHRAEGFAVTWNWTKDLLGPHLDEKLTQADWDNNPHSLSKVTE